MNIDSFICFGSTPVLKILFVRMHSFLTLMSLHAISNSAETLSFPGAFPDFISFNAASTSDSNISLSDNSVVVMLLWLWIVACRVMVDVLWTYYVLWWEW